MSKDNVYFIHEYSAFKLLKNYDNVFDENIFKLFYSCLRHILWHFSSSIEETAIVGIEFYKIKNNVKIYLVSNDTTLIEIKNKQLEAFLKKAFSKKFEKVQRIFIHWNDILKEEEAVRQNG